MPTPHIDTLDPPDVPVNWPPKVTDRVTIKGGGFTRQCKAIFANTFRPTDYIDERTLKAQVDGGPQGVTGYAGVKPVCVYDEGSGERSNEVDFIVTDGATVTVAAPVVAAGAGFGIISSILYTRTATEKLFNLGARSMLTTAVEDSLGYGPALIDKIKMFNNAGNVKVIITFGGNVSALAAASHSDKPFLSVFGNLTPALAAATNLRGGINLDTTARNAERFYHLNDKLRIPAEEICFLRNPASGTADAEQEQWKVISGGGRFYSAKDAGDIVEVFNAFRVDGTLSTMIVSADPLFQENRETLITAANGSGKRVSYPLQSYSNAGGTPPKPGRHWLHGPKLARSCFQLGRDAAMVLKNVNQRFPLRVPPLLLDSNDDES